MVDESIVNKIKALLAMAEHPNSNENEAAMALERAQKLLLDYNLTRADVLNENHETPQGIGKLDGTEAHGYTWKRHLLHVLAQANLCKVIGSPSTRQWHIFGTYDNVKAVLEMYHWVIPQLEEIKLRKWAEYKENCGYENAKTWGNGFYYGACITIKERLQKPLDTFTAQPSGHALVVYNTQALSTAVHKVFPRLTSSHYGTRSSDGLGYGRQAGHSVTLTPVRRLSSNLMLS